MRRLGIVCIILLTSTHLQAQDPLRFASEVEAIQKREFERDTEKPLALFVGSSSIRMWTDLEDLFPEYQVRNHGFGGSEFSDLIHFKQELIFDYSPDYLFIYEGDNDISSGKHPEDIIEEARSLLLDINKTVPNTKVFFISPKPSVSRWHLKDGYELINTYLSWLQKSFNNTKYIDVWTPMLDNSGKVRKDIFIEDNLHMNAAGYKIWKEVIGEHLQPK